MAGLAPFLCNPGLSMALNAPPVPADDTDDPFPYYSPIISGTVRNVGILGNAPPMSRREIESLYLHSGRTTFFSALALGLLVLGHLTWVYFRKRNLSKRAAALLRTRGAEQDFDWDYSETDSMEKEEFLYLQTRHPTAQQLRKYREFRAVRGSQRNASIFSKLLYYGIWSCPIQTADHNMQFQRFCYRQLLWRYLLGVVLITFADAVGNTWVHIQYQRLLRRDQIKMLFIWPALASVLAHMATPLADIVRHKRAVMGILGAFTIRYILVALVSQGLVRASLLFLVCLLAQCCHGVSIPLAYAIPQNWVADVQVLYCKNMPVPTLFTFNSVLSCGICCAVLYLQTVFMRHEVTPAMGGILGISFVVSAIIFIGFFWEDVPTSCSPFIIQDFQDLKAHDYESVVETKDGENHSTIGDLQSSSLAPTDALLPNAPVNCASVATEPEPSKFRCNCDTGSAPEEPRESDGLLGGPGGDGSQIDDVESKGETTRLIDENANPAEEKRTCISKRARFRTPIDELTSLSEDSAAHGYPKYPAPSHGGDAEEDERWILVHHTRSSCYWLLKSIGTVSVVAGAVINEYLNIFYFVLRLLATDLQVFGLETAAVLSVTGSFQAIILWFWLLHAPNISREKAISLYQRRSGDALMVPQQPLEMSDGGYSEFLPSRSRLRGKRPFHSVVNDFDEDKIDLDELAPAIGSGPMMVYSERDFANRIPGSPVTQHDSRMGMAYAGFPPRRLMLRTTLEQSRLSLEPDKKVENRTPNSNRSIKSFIQFESNASVVRQIEKSYMREVLFCATLLVATAIGSYLTGALGESTDSSLEEFRRTEKELLQSRQATAKYLDSKACKETVEREVQTQKALLKKRFWIAHVLKKTTARLKSSKEEMHSSSDQMSSRHNKTDVICFRKRRLCSTSTSLDSSSDYFDGVGQHNTATSFLKQIIAGRSSGPSSTEYRSAVSDEPPPTVSPTTSPVSHTSVDTFEDAKKTPDSKEDTVQTWNDLKFSDDRLPPQKSIDQSTQVSLTHKLTPPVSRLSPQSKRRARSLDTKQSLARQKRASNLIARHEDREEDYVEYRNEFRKCSYNMFERLRSNHRFEFGAKVVDETASVSREALLLSELPSVRNCARYGLRDERDFEIDAVDLSFIDDETLVDPHHLLTLHALRHHLMTPKTADNEITKALFDNRLRWQLSKSVVGSAVAPETVVFGAPRSVFYSGVNMRILLSTGYCLQAVSLLAIAALVARSIIALQVACFVSHVGFGMAYVASETLRLDVTPRRGRLLARVLLIFPLVGFTLYIASEAAVATCIEQLAPLILIPGGLLSLGFVLSLFCTVVLIRRTAAMKEELAAATFTTPGNYNLFSSMDVDILRHPKDSLRQKVVEQQTETKRLLRGLKDRGFDVEAVRDLVVPPHSRQHPRLLSK